MVYGTPQGCNGTLASRTPIPGTMTTSCRRTQEAVRNGSMTLPSTFSTVAVTPDARCSYRWYQSSGIAPKPYLVRTCSGPMHMASSTASG